MKAAPVSPWVLRVASRPESGGGHVRRCLALATAIAKRAPVVFVLDPEGGQWIEPLRTAGFPSQLETGAPLPCACAILDGYQFDPSERLRWRHNADCLAIIDDYGASLPEGDVLVRIATPAAPPPTESQLVLAGLAYALIDANLATVPRPPFGPAGKHLLVSFGLRDSANATSRTVRALARLAADDRPRAMTVVMGSGAPHLAEVNGLVGELGASARLRTDVDDMLRLYRDADCAIGAGGVGLLERMATGLPSLTVITAENQRVAVTVAASNNGTLSLGGIGDLDDATLANQLKLFVGDQTLRTILSSGARSCVDARGSERVATALLTQVQRGCPR